MNALRRDDAAFPLLEIIGRQMSFRSNILIAIVALFPTFAYADFFTSTPPGSVGGGPPSGTAGGDLSGTYPNPSIGSVLAPSHGGTGAISITQAPYNAIADMIFLTDGTIAASSTAFSSAGATFKPSDVGKMISLKNAGASGATLITTIAGFVDAHDVTLAAAASVATPSLQVQSVAVATAQSGAGSYTPTDTLTVSGGTTVTTSATYTILTTKLASATVNAAGSGGTNGACTLTGTTGAGTLFQVAATISGNAISALGSISVAGSYTTNPTSLAAEPVTSNCSLTGATLALKMGPNTLRSTGAGIYGALPSSPAATTTSGSGTGATLTLTSSAAGGFYGYGTDNATAIQAAILTGELAPTDVFVPAATTPGACYGYTPPLNITANLTLYGSGVMEQWGGGINVPLTTPQLVGSVLCPASNGQNAITVTGTSLTVNRQDIGFLWQTPFINTGDGFNYTTAQDVQGLSGSHETRVKYYGHDGNHYADNWTNPLLDKTDQVYTYGGGVLKLYGNASSTNFYGNSTFVQHYGQVIVGGSANGFDIEANASQRINLMTFTRPQAIIDNVAGVSPPGIPPTSAQSPWFLDGNVQTITTQACDFETNVGASITMGSAGNNNVIDFSGCGLGNLAGINSPAWGTNGILYGPKTRTFNDTTSSGAVGNTGMFVIPGTHVNDPLGATTYAVLASLYVAPPICGVNCAATQLAAIYATGQIVATGALSGTGGAFVSGGTINLNQNSTTNPTNIGTGSTSGQVTVGGGSNKVAIGSGLTVGSTTALTTNTGEVGLQKITASGSAPGAAGIKYEAVCGTNAGSAKIIVYGGTSTTPVTLLDNIGSGVTGC